LPVRKPPGPLPGTGNGVIQLTIAPSSQGVRGAEWDYGKGVIRCQFIFSGKNDALTPDFFL